MNINKVICPNGDITIGHAIHITVFVPKNV